MGVKIDISASRSRTMGLQGDRSMINNIKGLCQERGITGYRFWKMTGMPQSTAYRLYSDPTAYPSKEHLLAICHALEVSPATVFWQGNSKIEV